MTDTRPLSTLTPWSRNYNRGDVEAIRRSIARFGFNGRLAVWRDDVIVAGNHAWQALVAMRDAGEPPPTHILPTLDDGDWLVPIVDVTHLPTREEAYAYAIADNRTRDLAETDAEALVSLLQEVMEADPALMQAASHTEADVAQLLSLIGGDEPSGADAEPDIERAEELQAEWGTASGQLWRLGDHRLAVGDSRDAATLAHLVADETPACMWTDPPYGVDYTGGTADAMKLEGDLAVGLDALLASAFTAADHVLADGAALYVAHPAGAQSATFLTAFLGRGWQLRQTLVWVKDALVLGHSDYHYRHEPILFGYKPADGRRGRGAAGWYGGHDQTSVFEIPRPKRSELHPTMKPVELVAGMVANSTKRGEVVLDPFCGSGSTLIACEQLERQCRAVEIDSRFAAVTLQRWADATGGKPEREEGDTR